MDNPEKPFTVLEWCAGYGVIPAVSAKAFITLYDELTDGKEETE